MASISRRDLLAQAGAASLASALQPIEALASMKENQEGRSRRVWDLDPDWKFQKGDAPGAQAPHFDDSGWHTVGVPHDWSIEGPFDQKEKAQGSLPTGIGWYRKRFTVPASQAAVWRIHFDGVYENSEVWINGHYLGIRPYGYVPFHYELTPYLKEGENVLAVKVDNSKQPNCRWYSGSGIYRHVRLEAANVVHVAPWGVFVTFPEVSASRATAQIKTLVVNAGKQAVSCGVITMLAQGTDPIGPAVETTQKIPAGSEYEFTQQLVVEKPHLWSHDDPFLYTAQTRVSVDGKAVDAVSTPVGIREALFDAKRGFLLNGERAKLNGVCLHNDGGCVGAAVPAAVWERRLSLLKEMGCNAIRTSHNPPASEFLDLCDQMGFLVMAEAFDEWKHGKGQIGPYGYANYFDEWYERDVTNFVRRDRNHPSIVLWSAGNEIGDQSDPNGAETLRRLKEVFHREDPTRLVTAGCDQIASEPLTNRVRPEFLEELDVVGYNYVDRWRERIERYYEVDRQDHPEWRVIGTESESMGGTRGEYRYLFEAETQGFMRMARGRMIDVEQLWKFVRLHDYVVGDFMWTGIDYLGEARWPGKGASSGVIDTCGFKKDGFYFYQSQWTSEPMLHLFPHWNWAGKEGQFIPVMCYTNCDTVELFLNGKSVGEKGYAFPREGMEERWGTMPERARQPRTTADLHLEWDVPYEPGTLRAVGRKSGKDIVTMEVSTAGEPAGVVLRADPTGTLSRSGRGQGEGALPAQRAGRDDEDSVAHVVIQIVDNQGRVVPDAKNEVTISIEGGTLIGMDSGDPMSHESYQSPTRKAFHGLCLALVRVTGSGEVQVRADSPGLQPGSLKI